MAEPLPLILDNAGLKINGVELACVTNHLELSPDVSITTLDTMCGSKDYPGTVKWSLVATLYQSFDPLATEEVLSGAVAGDVPVPYEIVGYRDRAVDASNPRWFGLVIPQPYAPINGDAGDASTVELEWSTAEPPTKETTPGTKATGATAGTPGQFTPAGSAIPADLAELSAAPAVVAEPTTAWTTGEYVVLADLTRASWDGAAWAAGPATLAASEEEGETRSRRRGG
jgi:hypothetical protein